MTDVQTHHITLEMDKLRDAKDQQARNQVSYAAEYKYIHVCVCVRVFMWICMYDFY